ncbi:MAG TPA: ATPase, partial [Firmicutes bacterium]|nr:ATPase [Bacillota bacterium]
DKAVMERKPRAPGESIFSGGVWQKILTHGAYIGIVTIIAFFTAFQKEGSLPFAQTAAFSTLILAQLVYVFECRWLDGRNPGIFSNIYLIAAVLSSAFLLVVVIYNPLLGGIFSTVPLKAENWFYVTGFALIPSLISRLFRFPRKTVRY